jgi:predicted DCC family thiol-disulfide oxidoreductase YuxK
MIYHSDNLVALHAIVLGFTRCADALSLDALFRARKKDGDGARESISWMYGWPVKLICAVTVCTYFVTAVAKLMGPLGLEWMTGPALRSQMAVDGIRKELLGGAPNALSYAIYEWLPLFTVLAIGSLLTELLAPLALFNRRLGRLWAINAFLMHLGILEMMRITFHYQLWGVMFASFFPLERLVEWPRKLWRRPAPNEPRESTKRQQSAKPPPLPEPSPGLATAPSAARATIYYDGECGLCDRFVQFVLRHDHREHFQFATLQSDAGRAQLRQLGLPETELKTVVLGEEGKLYERSTATLRVCRRLGGLWPLCFTFIVIPKRWRDGVYTLLTRNRRRGFKDTPACEVIPPHWRRRFIN